MLEKEKYRSREILVSVLGEENVARIEPFLHTYDGSATSVKPVAKHITIYWVGRLGSEAVLRTEGEDDIVLTRIRDKALPTLIFRKFKATMLRAYMEIMRSLWVKYRDEIMRVLKSDYRDVYGEDYDFLGACGISPGIEGRRGTMHPRCMKCPVDILMGAVTGRSEDYNLASRLMGDPAFATTETYRRRTGNAVDEVTYITGMGGQKTGEAVTGALYTETIVDPGTIFVGKTVLFMSAPVELAYMLALLVRAHRYGARKSIMGVMEIEPVALIGDHHEIGTAYAATERSLGLSSMEEVKDKVKEYIQSITPDGAVILELDRNSINALRKLALLDKDLFVEAWRTAALYVRGIREYIHPPT